MERKITASIFMIVLWSLCLGMSPHRTIAQTTSSPCPDVRCPPRAPVLLRPFTIMFYRLFGIRRRVCDPNYHPNVNRLILDRESVSLTEAENGKLITTINVATEATDPENDVLTYSYTVSAGKINGVGAKVVWNLSSAPKGKHSILVGVDDGAGICGKTLTQWIEVK